MGPTNKAAERAIRPAVLWQRTRFGTQSAEGSELVTRMLTVVMTLRAQQRNVLEYMMQGHWAAPEGKPAPSLWPNLSQPQCHLAPNTRERVRPFFLLALVGIYGVIRMTHDI